MAIKTTLRGWLETAGFDWETGVVIYQDQKTAEDCNGYAGHDDVRPGREISREDPRLDLEFNTDYGGCEAPRFFAKDANAVYFHATYDGSSWITRVVINPHWYTQEGHTAPCVGG